jgi:hypothetical protein
MNIKNEQKAIDTTLLDDAKKENLKMIMELENARKFAEIFKRNSNKSIYYIGIAILISASTKFIIIPEFGVNVLIIAFCLVPAFVFLAMAGMSYVNLNMANEEVKKCENDLSTNESHIAFQRSLISQKMSSQS